MTYDPKNYIQDAMRTALEQPHFVIFDHRRHAAEGIIGEVGEIAAELLDGTLDQDAARDELGDLCWYMAMMLHHYKLNFENYADEDFKHSQNFPGKWGEKQWIVLTMTRHAGAIMEKIKKADAYSQTHEWDSFKLHFCWLHHAVIHMCTKFGLGATEVLEANIRKLRARYPKKFTQAQANTRDRQAEAEALKS